jgi:hypothetical protein
MNDRISYLHRNNIGTIKNNIETLTDASKEVHLETNTEKIKYMLLLYHQNAGQNHSVNIANRSFENVAQFLIFGNDSNKQKSDSGGN